MKKTSDLTPSSIEPKQTFNLLTKNDFIVLIDNNEIDLFVNQKILELIGITNIVTFKNASKALLFLSETTIKYRLILIDIYLPIMDGFEFIDKFRALNLQNKHGEICFLSATINPIHIQQSINYQIRFIEKPLIIEKLLAES